MKGTVISYLAYKSSANSQVFDFRIHEVENTKDDESIWRKIYADRGDIPEECYVDWYL
jgi:hypothetical protein